MKTYIVDAFVSKEFKGNSAAVCILEENYSDEILRALNLERWEVSYMDKCYDNYLYRS